jgi:formylglycine-generating enzyme required for sulfatase activity
LPWAGLFGLCLLLCGAQIQDDDADETARGISLTSSEDPTPEVGYGRRHALIVGIDEYQDPAWPSLGNAVADAQAVAELLVERYAFEEANVHLLLDAHATRAAVTRELEDWASDADQVGAEDLMVVYFAGHGVTRSFRESERGYLVPADGRARGNQEPLWSTLVAMNDLEDAGEAIPAKHTLFLTDCCFGGLVVTRSKPALPAGLTNRARQVITAGDANQTVLDTGAEGHSVFTGALLSGLRGAADGNLDGVISFGELFAHISREVTVYTGNRQTPLQANLKTHGGGNVAFFAPGSILGSSSAVEQLRAMERSAEEQLEELTRLADALLVIELIEAEARLGPCTPAGAASYRKWLAEVRRVLLRLPLHEASVHRVRQEALLKEVVGGNRSEGSGAEPDWESADTQLRWRYRTFAKLAEDLIKLEALVPGIEARLAVAQTLRARSLEECAVDWSRAKDEVASDPRFGGLVLEPQLGLVPLGAGPSSGLQEFVHLASGEVPERGDDGRLLLTDASGVILVLLPGANFVMGCQGEDPDAPLYDSAYYDDEGPPHEVQLDPFFMSKYEVTMGQWKRWTGSNPSNFQPGFEQLGGAVNALHPVERVTWLAAERELWKLGLTLPTEARWEYAALAGQPLTWWTGNERETLAGAANIADDSAAQGGARWPAILDWPEFEDGWLVHAPVDALLPNPFGLHNVHGNVWELCLDSYGKYAAAQLIRPGDGLHHADEGASCTLRGGSYGETSAHCRGRNRSSIPRSQTSQFIGVRPARDLDRGD